MLLLILKFLKHRKIEIEININLIRFKFILSRIQFKMSDRGYADVSTALKNSNRVWDSNKHTS